MLKKFGGRLRQRSYTYKNLEKNGRLGNQLWQIAWQIGSAAKTGAQVCIKPDWEYRKYFSIPDEFFEKPKGKPINGNLFYQEMYHWDHIKEKIWTYFQPSDLAKDYLFSAYPDWIFDRDINKTSIHVRAGDYLDHPTIFPVPSDEYYFSAAKAVAQSSPDTRFLLFSDNIKFAKNKLSFLKGDVHVVEGVSRPVSVAKRKGEPQDQWDMFLMKYCNQNIIANSTFSWWGAFLGNDNEVYYPSVWWGPDIDAKDSRGVDIRESWVEAIPDDWRKVQC